MFAWCLCSELDFPATSVMNATLFSQPTPNLEWCTIMLTKKKGDEIITVMDYPSQINFHTTLEWSRTNGCLEVRKSILKLIVCFGKWSAIKYSRFAVNGLKRAKPQVLYDPLSPRYHHALSTHSRVFASVLQAHFGMYFTDHILNNGISA